MSWPSRFCSESRACYDFKCLRRLRGEIRQINTRTESKDSGIVRESKYSEKSIK
jgi:hypothetical protein